MNPGSPWTRGNYGEVAARIAGIAARTVDAVDRRHPLQNASVVDLACGMGTAALAAAARGARVIGVDATPVLLASAAELSAAAGLPVRWITADAADTGLTTGSVDAVISSMGLIFVAPQAQVDELARLLRPGGVLGFSAWIPIAGNPLVDPITDVLGPNARNGFSPEEWGDPATATARLRTNFCDIETATEVHRWIFESFAEAVRFVVEVSPVHVATIESAGEKRARLIAAFESAMAAHVLADGRVILDAPYRVTTARRR